MDKQIFDLIKKEEQRQREELQLIPSENYASKEVLAALGSVYTNKYSEGYPGKRYYQGNKFVDEVETLAIERAKQIFGAEHVNIQPLSGSPANLAVYFALLQPGDKILSMNLNSGGHLSHGSPVSIVSKLYNIVSYDVNEETGQLDYEEIKKLALSEKPKLLIAGASAYSREIDFKKFREIADLIGAIFMADIAHIAGLVAAGIHPSPVPFADVVTTTTHKTLRGPRGAIILCKKEFAEKIDKAVFPGGLQAGPHNNVHAAKAVAFYEVLQPEYKEYAKQVVKNAKALCDSLKKLGYTIVSGGTDNHLLVIDLNTKNIDGREAAIALEKAGIVVNFNTIPYEKRSPFRPSGIRLGTPAVTSRGMVEMDMENIANWIDKAIQQKDNEEVLEEIKKEVSKFASTFKLPGVD